MRYLSFYKNKRITEQDVFESFMVSLKPSIKVWDYFVNWSKVESNMDKITIQLNILNSLISLGSGLIQNPSVKLSFESKSIELGLN